MPLYWDEGLDNCSHIDREMKQMDAVNAYLNAKLPHEVRLQTPPGIDAPVGHTLSPLRALYGLKESDFLWQQMLQSALKDLGLRQVPGIGLQTFANKWRHLGGNDRKEWTKLVTGLLDTLVCLEQADNDLDPADRPSCGFAWSRPTTTSTPPIVRLVGLPGAGLERTRSRRSSALWVCLEQACKQ